MRRLLVVLSLVCLLVMLWAAAAPPSVVAQADTPTPTTVHAWPVHCYVLIEVSSSIPAGILADAWRSIRAMGQQLGPPNLITHYRLRMDNRAVLLESTFDPTEINRQAVINRLVEATGYTYSQVGSALSFTLFDCWQGYEASQAAARQYLRTHAAEWEIEP